MRIYIVKIMLNICYAYYDNEIVNEILHIGPIVNKQFVQLHPAVKHCMRQGHDVNFCRE